MAQSQRSESDRLARLSVEQIAHYSISENTAAFLAILYHTVLIHICSAGPS